jgi:hypothetical protein
MRGKVCSIQWLLGLASTVFLGPESCGNHERFVTNGGVVWLIEHGFGLERGLIHLDYSHLQQFIQQLLISTAFHWSFYGGSWADSSSWPNSNWLLLSWNLTCLWTAPWLLNSFSLFCWTPYSSTVLYFGLAYDVLAWTAKRLPIDTLAEADCWFVTAATRISNESRIRGYCELPWIPMSGYSETHNNILNKNKLCGF